MPRTRDLKPAFFQDEDLATVSRDHRLLFESLWTLADREGRLEDRPAFIKINFCPYDEDMPASRVDKMLDDLANHKKRFIVRYEVDGKRCIFVRNLNKHQHIHPKEAASVLPKPSANQKPSSELPGLTGKSESSREILPIPSIPSLPSVPSDPDLPQPSAAAHPLSQLPLLASGSGSEQPPCQPEQRGADKIREVFAHYQTHHPRSFPNPLPASREWILIRGRLREGYSVEDLCKAIDGYHKDPYHCGENKSGAKYQGLNLIMRDGTHVAEGIRFDDVKPGPVMSEREMRGKRAGEGFLARLEQLGLGDKTNGQG